MREKNWHQSYIFIKKKYNELCKMQDNCVHMMRFVHLHRHDVLTVFLTVQLQAWHVHCPISTFPNNTTHWPNQVLNPNLSTQSPVHWTFSHCISNKNYTNNKKLLPIFSKKFADMLWLYRLTRTNVLGSHPTQINHGRSNVIQLCIPPS